MEYQFNIFDDVRHKVCIRRLHCDDACFWLWKMKTKNNIYISSLASYCSAVLSILKQELDFCGFNWSKGSLIEVALYDRQFFNVCEFTGCFFLGGGGSGIEKIIQCLEIHWVFFFGGGGIRDRKDNYCIITKTVYLYFFRLLTWKKTITVDGNR